MFKRTRWFSVGVVVGVGGAAVAYVRARELARQHLPESTQDAAVRAARLADRGVREVTSRTSSVVGDWREGVAETRQVRRDAETFLRRQLERAGL